MALWLENDEGTYRYWLEVAEEFAKRAREPHLFAATNREAARLNRLAQAERKLAEEFGEPPAAVGGESLHERDRVMFTRNSRAVGVTNGDPSTVLGFTGGRVLVVRLDAGSVVSEPGAEYDHLRLGYC